MGRTTSAVKAGLIGLIDSIATEAAHDHRIDEVIAAIQRPAKHFLAAQPGAAAFWSTLAATITAQRSPLLTLFGQDEAHLFQRHAPGRK